jgi:hypothetical protein
MNLPELEAAVRPLLNDGRGAEAEALLRPHLAGGSGPIPVWAMLAHALRIQGRPGEARPILEMIVDALPGHTSFRFDLAETLLLLGEFERGWREYAYRYTLAHTTRLERKVQMPRWDGRPIPGKTLLIHDEQGYGDTFQFMRMVRWAKQKSQATVILEINHETASLAQRMGGFDSLTVRGQLPPPFDVHAEMMSLPMLMRLQLSDLPGQMPYVTADGERLARWRKRLAAVEGLQVAFVWAGRPTHTNDARRSLPLEAFAPLCQDGVTLLSIQKGPREGEAAAPPAGMTLVNLSPEIADFEDTAAILSTVDLLVSVDSSPVHLAGALGQPAWVMLPFQPDWRWLQDRTDSPWYPSLRLFRQARWGDWDEVIHRIAAALATLRNGPRRTALW